MICPACGHENIQGTDECENCGADLRIADIPQPGDILEARLTGDHLDHVRRREPVFVARDLALPTGIRTIQERHLTCLFVGDPGRLEGIVTDRDLVLRVAGRPLGGLRVSDVMTPDPVVLDTEDTVATAVHTMAVGGFRHVPLVEYGRVVGVVTAQDLFGYIDQILD